MWKEQCHASEQPGAFEGLVGRGGGVEDVYGGEVWCDGGGLLRWEGEGRRGGELLRVLQKIALARCG